jgi:two-component system, NtrC family, sensor histidine kinase HydH
MDLRTRTSLFCGVLALTIAVSILLRGRVRRPQVFFAALAGDIGLWYLAQWLYHVVQSDLWARFTAVLAVLLPQFAVHLFAAILPDPESERRASLPRIAGALGVPMLVFVLTQHTHGFVRGAVFLYVFGLIAAGLFSLWRRGERSGSRAVQRRVRFLVLIGALAAAFSLADFLWFIGAPLPPVSAVLAIVFLFVLSESLIRERLVDLYDVLVKLLVSTTLAFSLAGIFYVFAVLFGGFEVMYLGAILAAIVILLLFEPLRERAEAYVGRVLLRERVDLERAVGRARARLVRVLQLGEMQEVVMTALEGSRRATGAALYLRDPGGSDFAIASSLGPPAPARVEAAAAGPLLERLEQSGSVAFEEVTRRLAERRRAGQRREAEADERVLAAAELFGPFRSGLCLPIRGEDREVRGLLLVTDDRVRDAFSPDDIALLEALALQIGVVIENTKQYRHMQERDRLAVLGQMAAGLAHEIKNPLGAIKGAAQLLGDARSAEQLGPADREFLGIILEEVERLDRVVGSVLDYARPSKADVGSVDANVVVRGTLKLLASDRAEVSDARTDLDAELPRVRADAEQLRQVLINLIRNAVQAMGASGTVYVSTRTRQERQPLGRDPTTWVEIAVRDEGPGIAPHVMKNLFVPFVTTKDRGTGLGLAISQRVVAEMGGRIDVTSRTGRGSTFTVLLPAAADAAAEPQVDSTGGLLSALGAPGASGAETPATPAAPPVELSLGRLRD